MTMHELIFLGKNLVIEYNKRYNGKKYDIEQDKFIPNSNLTIEQVQVDRMTEHSNGILETILSIKNDPWWNYKIIYDPNKEDKISTIIEMK